MNKVLLVAVGLILLCALGVVGSVPAVSFEGNVKVCWNWFSDDCAVDLSLPGVGAAVWIDDWNEDGRKDLIACNYSLFPHSVYRGSHVYYFENTATDASPGFSYAYPVEADGRALSAETGSYLTRVDFNGDGRPDFLYSYGSFGFTSAYGSHLELYLAAPEGAGDFASPQPLADVDGSPIPGGSHHTADWNGDGLFDLLLGLVGASDESFVLLYLNTGTLEEPSFAPAERLMAGGTVIREGYGNNPFAADWDRDGKQDLILRRGDQFLFLRNIGTESAPALDVPADILTHSGETLLVSAGASGDPFAVVDWNNDGWLDIVAGNYEGKIEIHLGSAP
ncbi:MAG: VCBS repeat-containing protein [Candidatus Bipolaricaulia bacterium]